MVRMIMLVWDGDGGGGGPQVNCSPLWAETGVKRRQNGAVCFAANPSSRIFKALTWTNWGPHTDGSPVMSWLAPTRTLLRLSTVSTAAGLGKLQTLKQKWNYFLMQTINCMNWQSNVPFLPCQVGVLILNWQFFNINWIYHISWWRENIKTCYQADSSVMSFWWS